MSHSKTSVAFIIGSKNENLVVEYVSKNINDLVHFKIVITDTDNKSLEKFSSGLDLNYVPSLDKRGDIEIAKRAEKRQVAAIFIMNPPAISKQFPPDRLSLLIEKAWVYDVILCVNNSNIDLALSHLVSLKGLSGKSGSSKKNVNRAKQQALIKTFPSFDEESDQLKSRREKASMWSQQQVSFKLKEIGEKYKEFENDEKLYFCFDEDQQNFLRLKCAPIEKSIEYLTIGREASLRDMWDHSKFVRDFLISHHEFTNSLRLMKLLRVQYSKPPPSGTDPDEEDDHKPSFTVVRVLRDWILMEYGSDFVDNDELCKEFDDFVKDIGVKDPPTANSLKELLETALELTPPYPVDPVEQDKAPKPILPKKNKDTNKYDFSCFGPTEVARQMTLMDEQLFHKVRAKEFLGGAWTKKDAMVRAPNLTKFINHTNRTASWLVTEILKQITKEDIQEVIVKLIRIGKELLDMRNYNGVMNVLTALHSAPVGRLKKAWDLVPNKDKKDFEDLTDALSLLGHYKNYRETLKKLPASTPCIPLIPVTCSDLNGLGEVLPNLTDQGWINWDKHTKVANHIWSVKRFMRARFIFKPVETIQKYIESADIWEGDQTLSAIARLRDQESIIKTMEEMRESTSGKADDDGLKMTERDWQLLSAGSEIKKYGAGEVILGNGVVNRHLFRIKKGTVRVEKVINGNPTVIAKMKEKEMFGEISMLLRSEQGTTTASIIADEVTEIIKYRIEFVIDMCRTEPILSEKLNKILSSKLAERLRTFGSIKKQEETTSEQKKKSEAKEKNLGKSTKLEKKGSMRLKPMKTKKNDEEIITLFGLSSGDAIATCLQCSMKITVTQTGQLYLTQKYLCFTASLFGKRTKEKISLSSIQKLTRGKNRIELDLQSNKIIFKDFENLEGAYTLINNFYESSKSQFRSNDTPNYEDDTTTEQDDAGLEIHTNQWNTIFAGTKRVTYSKDSPILIQGQTGKARLFQLCHGKARIEKNMENGDSLILAKIGPDSIFGEISFLDGSPATASVIADEDNTTVNIIEEYYLQVLFDYYPDLAGRFYHHLATILSTRLKKREQELSGKVDDEETEISESGDENRSLSSSEGSNSLIKKVQNEEDKVKKKRKSSKILVSTQEERSSPSLEKSKSKRVNS